MAYTREQYDKVKRRIAYRRLQAESEYEDRIKRIRLEYPELMEVRAELIQKKIEFQKAEIYDLVFNHDDAKKDIRQIEEREKALLKRNGLCEKDFDMHYTCEKCRDTGIYNGRECECFEREMVQVLYEESNLLTVIQNENFESLRFDLYSSESVNGKESQCDRMMRIADFCKKYCKDFMPGKSNSLLFYGPVGTGKTFFSSCIAKEVMDRCNTVIYLTASKMFDLFTDIRFQREDKVKKDCIESCDLLIIDDLGTEADNRFTAADLFDIVNARLVSGMATIISTNLNVSGIKDTYDERISSRIRGEYKLIEFSGRDVRYAKKKGGR